MGDIIKALQGHHENEINLSIRRVKSIAGAKRFGRPVGSPITKQIVAAAAKKKPEAGKPASQDHDAFEKRVAELRAKLTKLDVSALRALLAKLDNADIPRTSNYKKIRAMIKKHLEQKMSQS